MKLQALVMAAALGCGGAAFAADTHDSGSTASSSARATAHRVANDFKQAVHKLGVATRHALHRADAAIHHDRKGST